MDKWILLIFSGITLYATFETISWFLGMLKASDSDVEKTMGYSTPGKSSSERKWLVALSKSGPMLFPVFVMVVITITTVSATIRAFQG